MEQSERNPSASSSDHFVDSSDTGQFPDEEDPIIVDNDDRLDDDNEEDVPSDDDDFNARHQFQVNQRGNFVFPEYPRVSYNYINMRDESINKAFSDLLSSSPKAIFNANDYRNLSTRQPTQEHDIHPLNRKGLHDFIVPMITIETMCDLSESFLQNPLTTRKVEWDRSLVHIVQSTNCRKFEIAFQTGSEAYTLYQKMYSNAVWLMHMPASNSSTSLHFKFDSEAVAKKCVLVFVKNLSLVRNFIPKGNRPSIWPDVQGRRTRQNEKMVKVRAQCFLSLTPENEQVINELKCHEEVAITYVGQMTQYLKGLRMATMKDRPAHISPKLDYNVSPILDAIIDPSKFNSRIFEQTSTIAEKFNALMNSEDVSVLLVDGGPGTGKTSNVANTIGKYFADAKAKKIAAPRILITAPSNAAADVFYKKLVVLLPDKIVCRIGDQNRFGREVRTMSSQDEYVHRCGCYARRDELENELAKPLDNEIIRKKFILDASVVVVTLGSSQSRELVSLRHRLRFDLIVVDECGQAKLEEFLFPFHFTFPFRIIVIGDPRQLGPTLKSSLMLKLPLKQTSIFVRLYEFLNQNAPSAITTLREQFRMRNFVASMVSRISYKPGDRLVTNPTGNHVRTNNHPALLVFSGESWVEKRSAGTFSYENIREAEFGMALLQASLRRQGYNFATHAFPEDRVLTYAIIPLYRGQQNLFNRLINERKLQNVVRVCTVDQMQGSECDIAIISAVRSSPSNIGIGFASDIRRLNVALSRAACVYVLVKHGDFYTHTGWHTLIFESALKDCAYSTADQILLNNGLDDILQNRALDGNEVVVAPRRR